MCRVSLVASTMLLLHGVRCSGATSPMYSRAEAKISRKRFRVPHGATILPLLSTSICDNLLSKNNLKNSGHDTVVDRILCIWFCGPKKSVRFRFSKLFHKRWPKPYFLEFLFKYEKHYSIAWLKVLAPAGKWSRRGGRPARKHADRAELH